MVDEYDVKLVEKFKAIGLEEKRAIETAKNNKVASALQSIIAEAPEIKENCGTLFLDLIGALNSSKVAAHLRPHLSKHVGNGDLNTLRKIQAAVKYLQTQSEFNEQNFKEASGVGITVSESDIDEFVRVELEEKEKDRIVAERYRCLPTILRDARDHEKMKWASGAILKFKIDELFLKLCGPKTDELDSVTTTTSKKHTNEKPTKNKREPIALEQPLQRSADSAPYSVASDLSFIATGDLAKLHKVGENPQLEQHIMVEHLKRTNGEVRTRFPPEPNGFLHIGHAKAINVNFCYALAHKGGKCILRYDDTNPEAEEQIYFDSILETVKWLGFEPYKITYSSDYFQQLYELAIKMIELDKAYICHCSAERIKEYRGGDDHKLERKTCEHRNRPISESLKEFQRMKNGEYKVNEATLRMKMDMTSPNPQFWDLIAYRVLTSVPHHRTGWDWKIYPTYDYTHCLVDSFEDITHSMCTTEFTASRESYYWLIDIFKLYKPVQWEYGKLNITNTVLSKRKLLKLVQEKIVDGWDDPRLYTLSALRRRGFPAEAINNFVRDNGVSMATTIISVKALESSVRSVLDSKAARLMCILKPLRIEIPSLRDLPAEWISLANNPKDPRMGTRVIALTNSLYLDYEDIKFTNISDAEKKQFYRLALNQKVGLNGITNGSLQIIKVLSKNKVVEDLQELQNLTKTFESCVQNEIKLICEFTRFNNNNNTNANEEGSKSVAVSKANKPKTFVHWVPVFTNPTNNPAHSSFMSPINVQCNIYNDLFLHANPNDKELGGFLNDINPNSLTIHKNAVCESGLRERNPKGSKIGEAYQFLRTGYFSVDKSTNVELSEMKDFTDETGAVRTVQCESGWKMNLVVTLKEDSGKSAI